jgi:hypothetical protein
VGLDTWVIFYRERLDDRVRGMTVVVVRKCHVLMEDTHDTFVVVVDDDDDVGGDTEGEIASESDDGCDGSTNGSDFDDDDVDGRRGGGAGMVGGIGSDGW